ncbi:MAG: glycosyltransferase family 87 protein [Gaiellales bacterium]
MSPSRSRHLRATSQSSFRPAEPPRAAAALLVGLTLLTASWGLLHVGFYERYRIVDTPVYREYGEAVMDGEVPYRDFDVEYPPLALPVFVVPALAPEEQYEPVFELLMWACAVAMLAFVVLALRAAGAGPVRLVAAAAFVGLAPLALGSLVLSRYDLWPAALTAGALAAFVSGRERLGYAGLGLGAAAKIYPLVLVPVALAWTLRRRGWREAALGLGITVGVLGVVLLPIAVIAPEGLADSLGRQLGRPLQIESLGAAVLLAAHQAGVYDPTVVSSHGSQNLDGPLADALAAVQSVLQGLALLAVWLAARRGSLLAGAAAGVTAFVAFGKVLSPQFLVWLLPLVPLVAGAAGLTASGLLVGALVTTQLWFPYRYWDVVALEPVGLLVLVRDLLLAALFAVLLFAATRPGSGAPRSP